MNLRRRWRLWRARRRFDHARAAFIAAVGPISEDELATQVRAVRDQIRAERTVRHIDNATITEVEVHL